MSEQEQEAGDDVAPLEEFTGEQLRAPFPWFGGKSRVAHLVWEAFGDVYNYSEPFAGSLACLLARPTAPRIETVNDLDCYLSNFWRALAADPLGLTEAADWPVNEADLHARHRWLVGQAEFRERMKRDPDFYDVRIAGWWVWGLCQWIGGGWCAAPEWKERTNLTCGADTAESGKRPNIGGTKGVGVHRTMLTRGANTAENEPRPHLGHAGLGLNSNAAHDVHQKLPAISGRQAGRGVNGAVTTEENRRPAAQPMGLNGERIAKVRGEPNGNERPSLLRNGKGINAGRARDLGGADEWEKRPSLGKGARGVQRLPVGGLKNQMPMIAGQDGASGRGIHASGRTSPLLFWMQTLAARLRRVRVCCGSWERILGPSSTWKMGVTGVLLDPPYGAAAGRDPSLYAHDSLSVSKDVREWCIENGGNPKLRIALCGYEGEHEMPADWRCVAWKAAGGYAAARGNTENSEKERIWFSPHCLAPVPPAQRALFEDEP